MNSTLAINLIVCLAIIAFNNERRRIFQYPTRNITTELAVGNMLPTTSKKKTLRRCVPQNDFVKQVKKGYTF